MIPGAVHIRLGESRDRGVAALPAGAGGGEVVLYCQSGGRSARALEQLRPAWSGRRSEEHTSELQSRGHLVCRLLLETKKHSEAAATVTRPCARPQRRGW